jgi:catechol 2,3-dioxygenase-like lactoylglutathione lyase family enzyme
MPTSRFDDQVIFQVAFITDDIEKTKTWMAEFFDMPVPETRVTDPLSRSEAEYKGKPTEARGKLAFFNFGNTTLELIEPDSEPSCWREFLDRNGPGFHHFAFKVKGMKDKIATFEKSGYPLLQKGEFEGGRYAYFDTEKQLGSLIELLEFDKARAA